jgi:serine/threonine protein phosphatase PrpC/CRP-like cAMP-binding protein
MDGGNAPLTSNEIQERIEAPASSQTVKIGSYTIQYAFISQRGFYPDDRDKANQDAYAVEMQFGGHKDRALFMVFDGHGKEGELCAQFCRDHLPPTMAKSMTSKDAKNPVSIESAMMQAFMRTNEALHAADNVDDSLSGTTAVGILFDGRDMYVANVGDSRAIVCQEHEGRLQAKPLSCDQTPYRKDERERVKACGARVMSMDQIEGLEPIHENWGDVKLGEELDEGGDPPRIWSPFGEYPGTAFTRSMGDVIAEELGVFAEPEVIRRRLQPSDRFVVVASDGVFEFLTNQSVADMIARYKDPLEACKKVVQEAYDLWLQYEVRTDDITIIAMYLDGLSVDGSSAPLPAASNDLDDIALHGLRPVRREMSRTRQRELILDHGSTDLSAWNGSLTSSGSTTPRSFIDSDAGYKVEDHVVKKSKEEREAIELAMGANFLFDHVTEQQKGILLDVMRRVEVRAGEYVIREGEEGDRFYIINQGQFEVRVKSSAGPSASADEPEHEAGTLVHVYNPTDTIKPCFGHLSLLYSKPRSASVIAITDGILWALDRPVFRRILVKKSRREIARVLRQVDVLRSLNLHQLSQLCDVFTEVEFAAGESIISQGEVGDTFYILEAGSAMVTMDDGDGKPVRELRRLRPYSYFGERALLLSEPRSANVVAVSPVRCLVLSQNAFEQVLGPLQGIIDEDRKAREGRRTVPSLSEVSNYASGGCLTVFTNPPHPLAISVESSRASCNGYDWADEYL